MGPPHASPVLRPREPLDRAGSLFRPVPRDHGERPGCGHSVPGAVSRGWAPRGCLGCGGVRVRVGLRRCRTSVAALSPCSRTGLGCNCPCAATSLDSCLPTVADSFNRICNRDCERLRVRLPHVVCARALRTAQRYTTRRGLSAARRDPIKRSRDSTRMHYARGFGIVAAALAHRPLVLAAATAVATGALVCLVMLGGSPVIILLACIAGVFLLVQSPSAFALLAWMLFALVPEASGDIKFSSGLSGLTYRSFAGPLDLADLVLGLGILATLIVRPSAPIEFYRRHRMLVTAYAVFLGVVALSIAANGLVLRPTALKPLVYVPVAAIWGYGLATSPRVATWVPPVLFVSAGISASLGLLNALGGTGVEFAGLHLAFKDRASVFLIVA